MRALTRVVTTTSAIIRSCRWSSGGAFQGGDTDSSAAVILASALGVVVLLRLAANASSYDLPGPWLNLANA